MARPVIIAPSILASDFGKLNDEVVRACEAGADWLHVDIMDGHFVPNISFGPAVCQTVHRVAGKIPLDVHLMIDRPDLYWEAFAKAGASTITIHLETKIDVAKCLAAIRAHGLRAGLAINPPTPLEPALPFLDQVDLFLCMTVNPGFGGQSFMPEVMSKVSEARAYADRNHLDIDIEVDGGINDDTAALSVSKGANVLVAGTSLFGAKDMKAAVAQMRRRLNA